MLTYPQADEQSPYIRKDRNAMNEGQIYQQLKYDLDGDGVEEVISLRAYNVDGQSYLGQLLVTDLDGNLIFEGPTPESGSDPLAFGNFHYGKADIQTLYEEYDGDYAYVSLIGALPVSDLRPTTFRTWSWRDGEFQAGFVNTLMEEPADSNYYVWQEPGSDYGADRWISKFWHNEAGELMGTIIDTTSTERVLVGEAKLVTTETGFGVAEWVKFPS